jgi:hypothetical protein
MLDALDPDTQELLLLLALLAAPIAAIVGLRCRRRARIIDDTPTSRVRSAAQGYVELSGRAGFASNETRAPLSGRPCVWWMYRVERRRESDRGRSSWETISRGTSELAFLLTDASDCCLVDPRGAEVFPTERAVWYGAVPWPASVSDAGPVPGGAARYYRYVEHRIYEHEIVGVIGEFRTVGGVADEDPALRALQLLRAWKEDQPALLRRFDVDGDGVLSAREWERARAQASRQVLAELPQADPLPRLNIVVRPSDGSPFLLAAIDLERLARRYRWGAAIAAVIFVVSTGLAVRLLSR